MKEPNRETVKGSTSRFFYQRQQWDALPEGKPNGILFGGKLPLPLTASVLDAHCGPYICGYGSSACHIPSLAALLQSDVHILGLGMHPKRQDVAQQLMDQIYIFSFQEDDSGNVVPLSVRSCYEAGWWCVSFPIGALAPGTMGNPSEHTPQVQAMLALLGKPTHICPEEPGFQETLERGVGRLRYRLIYEKEDYVLVFRLSDTVSGDYGLNFLSADSCLYYPKACWEQKMVDF